MRTILSSISRILTKEFSSWPWPNESTKNTLFPVHSDLLRTDGTIDNCLFYAAVVTKTLEFTDKHKGEHHTPEKWENMFMNFLHGMDATE